MKKAAYLIVIFLLVSANNYSQVYFPFNYEEKKSAILAYWYNCKADTAIEAAVKDTICFHSSLQVYGPVVADSFYVSAEVYLPADIKAYSDSFLVKGSMRNKNYRVDVINNYFLISATVNELEANPENIRITLRDVGKQLSKLIPCTYHKLSGRITDFNGHPLRSFLLVKPDGFDNVSFVWSDPEGYYEISLPERTYNSFYVNDGNYRLNTLEAWAWHIIADKDQTLDFKIGTGEVYNLNVWPNNGGAGTFFISFRPMVLFHNNKDGAKTTFNEKEYNLTDISPELGIDDIIVRINDKPAEILTVQKIFETGINWVMPSYIIQVRRIMPCFGKQSVMVEYNKTILKESKILPQTSMGYYQFYVNFYGLSDFN